MKKLLMVVAAAVLTTFSWPAPAAERWSVRLEATRETRLFFPPPTRTVAKDMPLMRGSQNFTELLLRLFLETSQSLMSEGIKNTGVAHFEIRPQEGSATLKVLGWSEELIVPTRLQITAVAGLVNGLLNSIQGAARYEAEQCQCNIVISLQLLDLDIENGRYNVNYRYGEPPMPILRRPGFQ